ncbi:hypothetical protein [Meiothermus sp.]|uniref:hypothetical protein n=1 Tax=Meiothermus sp. TaxID=1955249 RepID=UPI0021DD850F|nr:hypothetical protein [Meiothermus sp.]GIW35081.1 MAG: hypothetical protein KatS3mg072_2414 [Meiothermus sp.]
MGFLARWNLLTLRLIILRVLQSQTLEVSGILSLLAALLLGFSIGGSALRRQVV